MGDGPSVSPPRGRQLVHGDSRRTTNASKTSALDATFCAAGCPYIGLSGDVDGDGVLDYQRYWNVWTTSFDGSTTTGSSSR